MKYIVSFVFLIFLGTELFAGEIPQKWKSIGIPIQGIVQISKSSDQNGFYADYSKITRKVLWEKVSSSFKKSGFKKVGTAFGGTVIGFALGDDKIAMKIDQTGDILHLSLFNSKGLGSAALLHGVVFGKYKAEKLN